MSMLLCQSPVIASQTVSPAGTSSPEQAAGPQPQIWPTHGWLQPLSQSSADAPDSHVGVAPPTPQLPSSLVAPLALVDMPWPSLQVGQELLPMLSIAFRQVRPAAAQKALQLWPPVNAET